MFFWTICPSTLCPLSVYLCGICLSSVHHCCTYPSPVLSSAFICHPSSHYLLLNMISICTMLCLCDPAVNKIHSSRFVSFEMEPPQSSCKTHFLLQVSTQLSQWCLPRKLHYKAWNTKTSNMEGKARKPHLLSSWLGPNPRNFGQITQVNQVHSWSEHDSNEQLLLHINKVHYTTKKMGLVTKYDKVAVALK